MVRTTKRGIPEAWILDLPYGTLSYVAFILSLVGVLFFCLAAFKCWLTVSETDDYKIYIGYWKREDYILASNIDRNYCVRWHQQDVEERFDGIWRWGRAVGIIGALLGGLDLLFCTYIIVYIGWPIVFAGMILLNLLMALFSLSLLIGLKSEVCEKEDCRFGPGLGFAIVCFFIYAILACFMCKFRTMALLEPERAPPVEEEYYDDDYEDQYDDRDEEYYDDDRRPRSGRPRSNRSDPADEGAIVPVSNRPPRSNRPPPRSNRSSGNGAIVPHSKRPQSNRPPNSNRGGPRPSSGRPSSGRRPPSDRY